MSGEARKRALSFDDLKWVYRDADAVACAAAPPGNAEPVTPAQPTPILENAAVQRTAR